jgi:hypothetical protein
MSRVCYINYDNETGRIITVGNKDIAFPNLEITPYQADELLYGERSLLKYRIVFVNNEKRLIYSEDDHIVSKSYLVKAEQKEFPKFEIIRNSNNKKWSIKKFINEPFNVFLTAEKSKYNYIRVFELTKETEEFNFLFETELNSVDFYTNSSYASMNFKDE